jgi:type IV pilus assembly protein PilN
MIRVNLIPAQETQRAAGRQRDLAVGVVAVAAVALLFVIAHVWQGWRLSSGESRLARLNDEIARLQGPFADVSRMEQHKAELREKLRVISQLEARKVGPVRILADLAAATPDKLWITELADTGGTVKISGLGVDEHVVADFLRKLGTLPFLHRVDLDETSQVDEAGAKLKKFMIQGQIDYAATAQGTEQAAATPVAPGGGAR